MYVNQSFINGINANSPQVKMRMTIDGIVYNSDDHISNASFDFVASSFIGEFPSWKAIVTLAYDSKPDYRNKDVFIEIGSVVDGVTTYIAMGYFKIDVDGQETDDITKEVTLTMFDAAYFNFKAEYVPTVTYPCTGRQIIQDVANQAGIDLSIPFDLILDSFVFTGPLNVPTDATLREMVAHYASANLSIAYINRFGNLTFNCAFYKNNPAYELGSTHDYLSQFTHDYLSQFTHDEIFLLAIDKTIYTFDPDTYDSLKAENLYGPINSMLLSRSAEGDDETYDDVLVDDALSIAENGLYRIKIDNNYFTDNVRESVVQMLFDLASGFTYMPFDLNIFGRPDIDPGDLFNVTDTEGNTYLIPMVNITHTFNGGLMSTIDAGVVEQTLEKYTPAGIVKDLRRVSIKANKAEGEIVLLAEEVTDVGNKVSQLIVDVDSIELSFNKYENGELSGTKYVFDGDNATFYGGGLKIKNNDGDDVLYADTEGNLQLAGHIQMLQENEIVTVGTGGDFATINEALLFVQQKYPQFISGTNTVSSAEIRLKTGFVMNEQVLVERLNLGFVTITSDDAEVVINRSSLINSMNTSEFPNEYPAFGGNENAVLPVIDVLFNMNTTGASDRRHGIFVSKNSSAHIRPSKGIKNCGGYGIYAEANSNVNAESTIFTNSLQNGISANNNSRINCQFADVSGAGWTGIIASDTSTINAQNAVASGLYGIAAQFMSTINAENAYASGSILDINVAKGGFVNANGSTATNFSVPINTFTVSGFILK